MGRDQVGGSQIGAHLSKQRAFLVTPASGDETLDEGVEGRLADTNDRLPLRQVVADAGSLSNGADVKHDAQVDRYGLEAVGTSVFSQYVLVCVSGGILHL